MRRYKPGDHVVYRKTKFSTHPGPRAMRIRGAARGDDYNYVVDKLWTVKAVRRDGMLEVVTRRGKTHLLSPRDRSLRKASVLDEMKFRGRFPTARADLD